MSEIAIIGGGIGGLAAAAFLRRAGLRGHRVRAGGAARRGRRGRGRRAERGPAAARPRRARRARGAGGAAGDRLGVPPLAGRPGAVRGGPGDQVRAAVTASAPTPRTAPTCSTAISRAVPAEDVRLGKRCVGLDRERPARHRLRFADGESAEADVVIGADGIHSMVRAALTEPAPPTYSGLCAFRALVPAAAGAGVRPPPRADPVARARPPPRALPDLRGRAGQPGRLRPGRRLHDRVVDRDRHGRGAPRRVRRLGRAAHRPASARRARPAAGRCSTARRSPGGPAGTVTLLGDAAHPMFPFFGQGAAQAIEDAAVLARCLAARPGRPGRRAAPLRGAAHTAHHPAAEVSHARAHVNHLPDGPEQRARDASFTGVDPLAASAWIYAYDPEGEPPLRAGRVVTSRWIRGRVRRRAACRARAGSPRVPVRRRWPSRCGGRG